MPSLQRRREEDLRAGRLESVLRQEEMHLGVAKVSSRKGLNFCNRCKIALEEESKYCPKCDRKDETGHIKPIPRELLEQAKLRAMERSKARLGL